MTDTTDQHALTAALDRVYAWRAAMTEANPELTWGEMCMCLLAQARDCADLGEWDDHEAFHAVAEHIATDWRLRFATLTPPA